MQIDKNKIPTDETNAIMLTSEYNRELPSSWSDEDVKEIEGAIQNYDRVRDFNKNNHDFASTYDIADAYNPISDNAMVWLRLLLTKYTETLAQVEKKDEIIKTLSLAIGTYEKARERSALKEAELKDLQDDYEEVRGQLYQAIESLKQVSRLAATGNHILIQGVVRDTLQLIGGDEEDEHPTD